MKRITVALLVLLGAAPSFAQVPEIPFDGNVNFLKLPGHELRRSVRRRGQLEGRRRDLHALEQRRRPGLRRHRVAGLLVRQDGKFIREIGKGLYAWSFAHAVRIDKDDNIWAIDKGSDMIVRFNPEGRVTMVFGRKKEASDEAEPWKRVTPPRPPVDGQFRQPTDVAWDTEGNIYISDGYINSRVAKFTKNGDWVASMGEPGRDQDRRAQHAAHASPTTPRATSTSPIAATAASR